MREIEAGEEPLKNIFSDPYTVHIPRYQRPYVWEREHATPLLEDLLLAAGDGPEPVTGVAVIRGRRPAPMAARAVQPLMDESEVRLPCSLLVADLLEALS